MKKILIIVALFLCLSYCFAGPFGLSNGMSLEEVTKACKEAPFKIGEDENDDRYYISPINSHSTFTTYIAWINEEYGLYLIRANSDDIRSDDYGNQAKEEFYSFLLRLEKIYGEAFVLDELTEETDFWKKEDKYWFETLYDGARKLYATWYLKDEETVLKDDLTYICLQIFSTSKYPKECILSLFYHFKNYSLVMAKEDDVL